MDIKIIIATHRKYWMPNDEMYLPVHVGAAGKERIGYQRDDEGDNISAKNAYYCELTGLYWAWKNIQADYIGLVHYRRHFSNGKIGFDKRKRVIRKKEIEKLLDGGTILLPRPRNYLIETNYSQYAHAHHAIDLDTTREILAERFEEYLQAWDDCMKRTKGHRFNMFIMDKTLFNEYCTWLFDILFDLENRLDIDCYSKNDRRVFGFVSERLLDVWITTNKYSHKDIGYVFMEKQNWIIKGGRFVKRKLLANRQLGV